MQILRILEGLLKKRKLRQNRGHPTPAGKAVWPDLPTVLLLYNAYSRELLPYFRNS